jgi:hypothetical protein
MAAMMSFFDRFDDLPDGNTVLVLSYLNANELSHMCLMSNKISRLSRLNELWKPLSISFWLNYFRGEKWIEVANTAEENAQNLPLDLRTRIWKDHFLQNFHNLSCEVCIFAMSRPVTLGSPIDLHWFEPRYRWLAARCAALPEEDRIMCYSVIEPYIGAVAFICKMTSIELFPDGRALVSLLPVARAKFKRLWFESVPNNPDAPKLACGIVRELSYHEILETSSSTNFGGVRRGGGESGGGGPGGIPPPPLTRNELLTARVLELINSAAQQREGVSVIDLATAPETQQLFRLLAILQSGELEEDEEEEEEEEEDEEEDEAEEL